MCPTIEQIEGYLVAVLRISYDELQWFTPSFIWTIKDEYDKDQKLLKKWEYFLAGGKAKDFDLLFEESISTGKVIQWRGDRHNIKN